MNNIKYKYILTFALISLSIIYIIDFVSDIRLNKLIEVEKTLISTMYKSIKNEYSTHAKIIYENVINKEDILKIYAEAKNTPDETREKLYTKLKPMYENMITFKLRQLHFHLKNNDSFLRFHRPEKFGDNLSDVRATVKYVNESMKCVSGFEEGRILNGFRFVCPLIYKQEHIGSVEVSTSMNSIIESMSNLLDAEIEFILDEKIIDKKVFKSEQSNYKVYKALPHHYIEKNIKESKNIHEVLSIDTKLNNKRLDNTKDIDAISFYTQINSKSYITTMIDVKSGLSNHTVAHFIVLREHERLSLYKVQSKIIMFILIILVFLLLFFIYKTEKKKIIIQEQNKKLLLSETKFKKLFDLQKNITVVTDGKKLKMANDGMRKFFGLDYIEFFTKRHNDICDRFVESGNYFNINKVPKHLTWIETIEVLSGDKKIVVMNDSNDVAHAFNVSVSKYEGDDYLVLFTDISDTMIEKMNLSEKVVKDSLTGAFNREFIDMNIKAIIKKIPANKYLGVAMLDIDMFKVINDTHGHHIGDVALKELTLLIQDTIRENDFFIRWGGEEFIILLEISSKESLKKALEHVRQSIENYKFSYIGKLTCSLGASLYIDNEDIHDTISRADDALYESKESGRNQLTLSIYD